MGKFISTWMRCLKNAFDDRCAGAWDQQQKPYQQHQHQVLTMPLMIVVLGLGIVMLVCVVVLVALLLCNNSSGDEDDCSEYGGTGGLGGMQRNPELMQEIQKSIKGTASTLAK